MRAHFHPIAAPLLLMAIRMAWSVLLFSLLSCTPASASDDAEELSRLSLEELLQVKVMPVTGQGNRMK